MHVSIFIGSPKMNGTTAAAGTALANRLSGEGANCRTYYLYQHKISPCFECSRCKEQNMECVQQDGMSILYDNLEWADVIVFGTPIEWFGPSAQTKLMIDRFRPYFANKKLHGKRAALLLPDGAEPGDCDLAIEQFKRVFKALGMIFIDALTLSTTKNPTDTKQHDAIKDLVDKILQEEIA
ncbi:MULTISPECIES: flavodoxin family protein [unclassified Carboxylicivirga]|uniref:flavodoxin family protein n=1 Tax=Carboxylicivirga TaxID=1628153 RepID=UPI003D3575B8